jgi:hypothetical protein
MVDHEEELHDAICSLRVSALTVQHISHRLMVVVSSLRQVENHVKSRQLACRIAYDFLRLAVF